MSRLASIAGIALIASTGLAETFTFVGNIEDLWVSPQSWQDSNGNSGVPGAGDRAVILNNTVKIRSIDSITVDTVEVISGILIEGGGTLTLQNHNCGLVPVCGGIDSIVDGQIELKDNARLKFTTRDHTISGEGMIFSIVTAGGIIDIASGIFFRNELDHWDLAAQEFGGLRGVLSINGPGTIINDGVVEAVTVSFQDPDANAIVIDAITEDTADGRWIVNCESLISFKQDALLEGDFEDVGSDNQSGEGGVFQFDHAIVLTCGALLRTGCGGLNFQGNTQDPALFGYAIYVDRTDCLDPVQAGNPLHASCVEVDLFSTSANIDPIPICVGN